MSLVGFSEQLLEEQRLRDAAVIEALKSENAALKAENELLNQRLRTIEREVRAQAGHIVSFAKERAHFLTRGFDAR